MASIDTTSAVPPDNEAASRPGVGADVTIRPLRTQREFRACVEIQHLVWGERFTECVPPTILNVCQRIGGIAAGAFDSRDRLLGFVFGMTGVEDDEIVHWSDMLAVRPRARNMGLGRQLKQYQAEKVRALGATRIYWTYDPLVARNAHLNLTKLGAEIVEYVVDMYGETESELHRMGTDRFIVQWRLGPGEATPGGSAGLPGGVEHAPILNAGALDGGVGELTAPLLRVEVPVDIDAVRRSSLAEAVRWRAATRAAFVAAQAEGYRVAGFLRGPDAGPCYYVLAREQDRPEGSS